MDDLETQGDSEDQHSRIIIHIDMDYFYAQVEEVLNPSLKNLPLGVKQRTMIVTSNYIAREFGIKKMMLISEAKKLCPELVLVNGEDLTKYRQMSVKINEIMHKFTPNVEKLGLDENFLDITKEICQKLEQDENIDQHIENVEGYIHPPIETGMSARGAFRRACCCGCDRKLILATHIAKEIRNCVFQELGLKCSAGVSHNKLLAKLVGGINKHNKQTVLLPNYASEFVASLGPVKSLTGIGEKTAQILEDCGIKTVRELQETALEQLRRKLGLEQASKLKEMAFGRDNAPVKQTGKPKSVGLEDSCSAISIRADAEEKFRHLLVRLVKNIADDGRIPIAIKVTVRKHDSVKKTSHRECKQDKILPSFFRHKDCKVVLAEGAQEKILATIMKVFERMVDLSSPFNITLLGLSFFKFQERKVGIKSIANYLIKKSDIEVQSITNLSNEALVLSDGFASNKSFSMAMDCDQMSSAGFSDSASLASLSGSESDVEPSPKKSRRMVTYLARKKESLLTATSEDELSSPSKLRVAEMRLNSKEYDQETSQSSDIPSSSKSWGGFVKNHLSSSSTPIKTSPLATISNSNTDTTSIGAGTGLPTNVDPEVFNALPADVQQELLQNWRLGNPTQSSGATSSTASSSKNTLHRYFVKNT
ncbi:DNA polymerase iota [Wyeomyia smithii]|uniref:DNA polymerase iota n=1 Tax=Wyeomyia smithii TaxID=174621 RepID=UPI0024680C29|nr:DNA polymerase iota [Wyeomyia smithii]XP_055545610.1 DNA polymerase iota [Wyeomyia smithii]